VIYSHVRFQAAIVYGNQRPPLLAATERELWKCLLRINLGSSAMTQLMLFLQRFQVLEVEYAGKDLELDWFSPARKFFICLLLSIATNLLKEWARRPKSSQL
jgi:hypothetical protein